jgi:acyl carrier protein
MEVNVQIDREAIERHLIEAIQECMEASGKECPQLSANSIPFKEIPGFDSLCAIEVLVDVESKIGRELGEDLFVTGSGKTAMPRSVREVADAILQRENPAMKGTREKHA